MGARARFALGKTRPNKHAAPGRDAGRRHPPMTPAKLTMVALLVGGLWSSAAHATPQDLFGFGPRASAMGGTGAAFLDDYAAVYANPAALSRIRGGHLVLGYAGAAFGLRYDGGPVSADVGSATVLGVGVELPFGGILAHRVGFGLGLFNPTELVVRARIQRPEQPQFLLLPDRVQSVAIQVGLGVDLGHGLRLGVGASALAGLSGAVIITTDGGGRSSSSIDNQLTANWSPIVGVSWERGPWRVALTYRGVLVATFGVTIDARSIGVPLPILNISGVAQYNPHQLHLEGAWTRGPWVVALGVTAKHWSAFERVSDATSEGLSPLPPATGFRDTVVVRAGVERRWDLTPRTGVSVRGGLFYEPTPAPARTPERAYLDNDRLAVTAGLAMHALVGDTRFCAEIYGQFHGLVPRTGLAENGREVSYGGTLGVAGLNAMVSF
jgi:long-chain fatty acid transport protein